MSKLISRINILIAVNIFTGQDTKARDWVKIAPSRKRKIRHDQKKHDVDEPV